MERGLGGLWSARETCGALGKDAQWQPDFPHVKPRQCCDQLTSPCLLG